MVKNFFFCFVCLAVTIKLCGCTQRDRKKTSTEKVLVGAIRWDAWVGDLNGVTTGLEVETSLSPYKFHYRAPFFSKVLGRDAIIARETTQEVMDQDIAYAKYAGIDYWAFCYYPPVTALDTARKLYFNSKIRNGLNWCAILGVYYRFTDKDMKELVSKFKDDSYQKVLGDRPLVYIFGTTRHIKLKQLTQITDMAKANGINEPYFVLMSSDYKNPEAAADGLNANALSRYVSGAHNLNGGPYYPTIPDADKKGWEDFKATGFQMVPWVTTGRNSKPRIDRPVSWQKLEDDQWTADGTPQQIAENIKNAVAWVQTNKEFCEANTIIVYAWNEFDEGGWLSPTLGTVPGKIDSSRIEAVRKVLRPN